MFSIDPLELLTSSYQNCWEQITGCSLAAPPLLGSYRCFVEELAAVTVLVPPRDEDSVVTTFDTELTPTDDSSAKGQATTYLVDGTCWARAR